MLLPLCLGVLHAVEPDHVAVVSGVSLSGDRRGTWKVGLATQLRFSRTLCTLSDVGNVAMGLYLLFKA
jgi:hypothetical protein